MIEEKERPHGLPFRGREKAANLEMAHRAQPRLQYQDLSHFSRGAVPRHHLFTRCSSAQPSFHAVLFRATISALAHH
jgi:hypothetical protein